MSQRQGLGEASLAEAPLWEHLEVRALWVMPLPPLATLDPEWIPRAVHLKDIGLTAVRVP